MSNPNSPSSKPNPSTSTGSQKEGAISLDKASAFENIPIRRMEFAHENITLSSEHVPVDRIGYLGGKREQFVQRMNKLYGEGNWTLGYIAEGKALDRDQALELYQKSYEAFFRANPDYTQKMLREARDVYDTNVSNVSSGLNWYVQEDSRSHLQDIAVRRAVKELGLAFQGDKLLQIRGLDSDLPELNPGRVPFISGEIIITPPEFTADWVQKGSIEDFWQNNKFLFVRANTEVVRTLHQEVDSILTKGKRQDWKMAGEKLAVLVLTGDADIELMKKFTAYIEHLQSGTVKGASVPVDYLTDWASALISDLSLIASAKNFSDRDIMRICDTLVPAIRASEPTIMSLSLSTCQDRRVSAATICAVANHVRIPSFADGEVFHALLNHPEVMEVVVNNSVVQEYLGKSKLAGMRPEDIKESILSTCPSAAEVKERFISAISQAGKSL